MHKGGKVYFGSQFVEVTFHSWKATGRAAWQRRNGSWQGRQEAA